MQFANDFRHSIDQFGELNVAPNLDLSGLRFFVYCISLIMLHSHANDMEILGTNRFIPKGFELGTTLSSKAELVY